MKKVLTTIFLSATLIISGCATMFNGSSQQVGIRSNIDDVKLYVNEQYIGKSNGVTTFKKKQNYRPEKWL